MGWAGVIGLNLTPPQRDALIRTLVSPDHTVGARAWLLDLEHNTIADLSSHLVSGQVNIDAGADVTRQLQNFVLTDPGHELGVDTGEGAPRLNRMVRVYYTVLVEELEDWVGIPLFTGPITRVDRSEGQVSIEAMGKEHLAMNPLWRSRKYSRNSKKVDVIASIMRDLSGETHLALPGGWSAALGKDLSISKEMSAWPIVKDIAEGMGTQLYYDGRGHLQQRKRPVRPYFTFKDGDGGSVTNLDSLQEYAGDIVNTVEVIGGTPQGKSSPLTARAYLPSVHPHSPQSLGRGGKNRHLVREISDDTIRSQAEAQKVADRAIKEVQVDEQTVSLTCLPIPFLEELDPVTIDTKKISATVRINSMSVPLGATGPSTVGYLAQVSQRRR